MSSITSKEKLTTIVAKTEQVERAARSPEGEFHAFKGTILATWLDARQIWTLENLTGKSGFVVLHPEKKGLIFSSVNPTTYIKRGEVTVFSLEDTRDIRTSELEDYWKRRAHGGPNIQECGYLVEVTDPAKNVSPSGTAIMEENGSWNFNFNYSKDTTLFSFYHRDLEGGRVYAIPFQSPRLEFLYLMFRAEHTRSKKKQTPFAIQVSGISVDKTPNYRVKHLSTSP